MNSARLEKKAGLSSAQLFVLNKIGSGEKLSINEIAMRTQTDQSSVSVVVSKLVQKKLLKREISAIDRRQTLITLTSAGKKTAGKSSGLIQDQIIQGIHSLNSKERTTLSNLLTKLVRLSGMDEEPAALFFEEPHAKPKPKRNRK